MQDTYCNKGSLFGYDLPQVDADWLRFEGSPSDITLDTLRVSCDPLPATIPSRETTITFTDRINASSIAVRFVQSRQSAALKGDVNGDGSVDISDVNILINIMLGIDRAETYDGRAYVTDGDTNVDVADVNAVINIMLGK